MEKRKSYPSQTSLGKRALMLLLSIAMVLTMMPLLPGYVGEANAAADSVIAEKAMIAKGELPITKENVPLGITPPGPGGGGDDGPPTLGRTYAIAFWGNGEDPGQYMVSMEVPIIPTTTVSLSPNEYSRTGYRYVNWNTEPDGSGTSYEDREYVTSLAGPDEVVHLYAQWAPHPYKVQFNRNGGSGTMTDQSMVYDAEKALTANAFYRTGYTFSGWNTKADGSGTPYTDKQSVKNLTATYNGIVSLYAQWTTHHYTVKFDPNGGLGSMADVPMTYDQVANLPACGLVKAGATFAGWNTKADGSGTAYADKASVKNLTATNNGTATLYAQWRQKEITIAAIPDQTFTGQPLEPPLTVKSEGALLEPTVDYDVEYSNNIQPGTARAKVTFKGNYSGTRTVEFTIKQGTYTIQFDGNTGTGTMGNLDMIYGIAETLPANTFTKTGFAFTGWNTKADGSGTPYTDQQSVNNLTTVNNGTVTLYAQWEANTYTVMFDGNTGTGTMDDLAMIYGTAKALPTNAFTKEGHVFMGWNTEADGSGTAYIDKQSVNNLTATDEGTITLYAQWSANAYTVKFDGNTGTGNMSDLPMVYDVEKALTENAFAKTGYTFTGWNTKADGSGTPYTDKQAVKNLANSGTVTLYAQWSTNTYKVKFDVNGGLGTMDDQSMTYDMAAALTNCGFTKMGFAFAGWNTEADGSGAAYKDKQSVKNLTATNNDTVTLYAQWVEGSYAILFDSNSGMGAMEYLGMDYNVEKALTANAFIKIGYTFIGWNTEADGSGTAYANKQVVKNLAASGTVTLYAQWMSNATPYTYTIKFNANTGSGTMEDLAMTYGTAKTLTANGFTKANHSFIGWNTEADGSGKAYTDEQSVNNLTTVDKGTVTLYAQWMSDTNPNTYTIQFDSNTGSGTMDDLAMTYGTAKALPANAFTKSGYYFVGWNTEANGSGNTYTDRQSVNNLTTTNNGTVTLYAQWMSETNPHTYTVQFDSNGGTGTMSNLAMTYGTAKALPANAFTKSGYYFVGWNTEADGSGSPYKEKQSVKNLTIINNGTVTLYAQWMSNTTPNTYTIKFDGNTGTGTMDDLEMTYGAARFLPVNTFTKKDHTFIGWSTAPDGSGDIYSNGMMVSNLTTTNNGIVTLYALWRADTVPTPNTYTIKFDSNTGTGNMADMAMTYGTAKQLTANAFTKADHTFTGWNTAADGSGTAYADKQSVNNLTDVNNGTVTLYAQWKADTAPTPNTYTIKFDSNTGTGNMDDMAMTYGTAKQLTANAFTKADHTFTGWNTEADGSGTAYADKQSVNNLTDVNNGIVTLYAQWKADTAPTPNTYTIKFDSNTGTGNMADMAMTYGTAKQLTANAFTKADHTFTGWNTEADGSGTAYTDKQSVNNLTDVNNGTVTLYAQWKADTAPTPNTYTIKFDSNTGTGNMDDMAMTYGTAKQLTANAFTKADHTFTGWNTAADGSGTAYADKQSVNNLTDVNNGTVTLYAQWKADTAPTPNTYTIKFDANEGTGNMDDLAMDYDVEKALTANAFTKSGYTFAGWNTEADGSGNAYTDEQVVNNLANSGTVTLYAQWSANTYKVKFDFNTGTGTMSNQVMEYDVEKALAANDFTKTGYAFIGWNTAADGSGTAYLDKQVVKNLAESGTVTLYAQWVEGDYAILFDANNGTGTMDNLGMKYDVEKALPANAFSNTAHYFVGWNTEADGSGTAYADQQVVKNLAESGAIVLYAQWMSNTNPNTYTIKFDANEGSGTMDDLTMTYGTGKFLPDNGFTKANHTFIGWNTVADGSGNAYTNKQLVSNLTTVNNGTVILYAQWNTDGSGGTGGSQTITIEDIPEQTYTGKAIEPTVTVKADGTPLTPNQDFDVEYSDNVQPGTAKAKVTFKGTYSGNEAKTVEFTIKNTFKAKGLWVSKHENTYATFNWTGTPNNNLATGWDVQYRTKLIGTQYAWTKWTGSRESGKTLSKRVYLKPNHTIEFKVKHETDTAYLRSVFTTPAGGKYQSITQCRVKVVATASGAAYRQGTKTLALKTGINFSGDTGNTIYVKKGTAIKITPNHVYPRSNFSKYPRLYPNHAWYDVADKSVISLSGTSSTAGMMDSAVTIKGLNTGTTTIKITSCNGRGATLTIVVK